MGDGIKALINISNNQETIVKDMRKIIFEKLGIHTESEKLIEFINECIEQFEFNITENQYLDNQIIRIGETAKAANEKAARHEGVNYQALQNDIINGIKDKKPVINLDDDLKNLANQISNRFPETGISRDEMYHHFMSKKEQIIEEINKANRDVEELLVLITPKLVSDLEERNKGYEKPEISNTPTIDKTTNQTTQPIKPTPRPVEQQVNTLFNNLTVDGLVSRVKKRNSRLHKIYKKVFDYDDQVEIVKVGKQIDVLRKKLEDKDYAERLLETYRNASDKSPEMIYDEIMFNIIPTLKATYEKYEHLLNEENIRKSDEPTEPKGPKSSTTYVGANENEIRELINNNQYYSLLHAIDKSEIDKYSSFIISGLRIYMNKYYKKELDAESLDQHRNSYYELSEIYENFKDYISPEECKKVKTSLDGLKSFLDKEDLKHIEYDDAGYTGSSTTQQHQQAARR